MKGFGIYVKNDLLEPKHYKKMGESVWLYMWLLDKITSVDDNGQGKVLGGKPITYLDFKVEVGVHQNTYSRYIIRLREHGYINTIRTPHGLVIVVNKAKKGITINSDSPERVNHSIRGSDSPNRVNLGESQEMSIQYKTKQPRLNKTKQLSTNVLVDSALPIPPKRTYKTLFLELVLELGFSNKVKPTQGRLNKLKSRNRTFSHSELLTAAKVLGADSYMQGENDAGKRYGDIDYFLRSDENVDKYLNKDELSFQGEGAF